MHVRDSSRAAVLHALGEVPAGDASRHGLDLAEGPEGALHDQEGQPRCEEHEREVHEDHPPQE